MKDTALWIEFDGVSSEEYNICQVNFDNSLMTTEAVIPSRTINVNQRQNSSTSDFYSVTNSELEISLDLYIDGEITLDIKNSIIQWLNKNTYKKLRFETLPDNYYYVMATKIDLTHNRLGKGYFSVSFICNSPFAYTNTLASDHYIIDGTETIEINSNSVFDTSIIKILITTTDAGDVSIVNQSNSSEFKLSDVATDLNITADCYNHNLYVLDSTSTEVIMSNTNRKWLELSPGNNNIILTGTFEITFYWQGIKI